MEAILAKVKRGASWLSRRFGKLRLKTVFFVCLAAVMAVWSVLLLEIHYNGYERSYGGESHYHSDDAAQSNIMWDWQHGYRGGARVGDDNWFIKYPLYVVTNNLPVSPVKQLFINSWAVLVATAVLVMIALYQFSKRLITDKNKQKLALIFSSLTLMAIPAQAFGTIKMSNSRNIEIGIFLLLLLALYCYAHKDKWFKTRTKLKVAGLALLYGALCADDPLFVYLTLVPFGLLVVGFYFAGRLKLLEATKLFVFAAASFASYVAIKFLLVVLLPLRFYHHKSGIASFDAVLENTSHFFGSGIGIFGADIFGRQPASVSTVVVAVLLAVTLTALAAFLYNWKKHTNSLFYAYMAFLWVWIPLLGVVTTLTVRTEVSRYLILLPFFVPLGILLAVKAAKLQRQLVFIGGLVALAAVLMISTKSMALLSHSTSKPNAKNFALIDELKPLGITKGYAANRYAGINTLLSDRAVTIYPVVCKGTKPFVRDIFFDEAHLKDKAEKTFYLVQPETTLQKACSKQEIIDELGKPDETISLSGGMEALIYDYDIMSKMPLKK